LVIEFALEFVEAPKLGATDASSRVAEVPGGGVSAEVIRVNLLLEAGGGRIDIPDAGYR
jgi:hypothetical protein